MLQAQTNPGSELTFDSLTDSSYDGTGRPRIKRLPGESKQQAIERIKKQKEI